MSPWLEDTAWIDAYLADNARNLAASYTTLTGRGVSLARSPLNLSRFCL